MRDGMSFGAICLRALVYIVLLSCVMQAVLLEAQLTRAGFHEVSFVEFAQDAFLLVGCFFAWRASAGRSPYPNVALLLFTLLSASLIREQDNFLKEYVFHSAWQVLALLWIAPFLATVIRRRRDFLAEIRCYAGSFSFGLFAAGFLTMYVYAQLFGRSVFWHALLGDQYQRVVKRAAEETTELFGYMLLAFAMVELYLLVRRWRIARG